LQDGDATSAFQLVSLGFEQCPDGGTIFGLALGLVSLPELEQLVERALGYLKPGHELAERVIADASLQAPHLLHAHLGMIFEVRPNARTYYENWPWREAPAEELTSLRRIIASGEPEKRLKAWRCLLEMRELAALEAAVSL